MPELLRSPDFRAIWLIQSHKLRSQLEFWLILIGYDRKTRSISNRIYLVYVFIFFSFWIFAVLTLLAGFAGQVISSLPFGSLIASTAFMGGLIWIGVFLLDLYSASRRSPFVFSEPDAILLCMTPVDRRWVALFWFLGNWVVQALILGAGAIVLGYGYLEAQSGGNLGLADLPRYILAGLSMLVVFLPLLMAVQALAWAVGARRLSQPRPEPALGWSAPLLALGIIAAWVGSGLASRSAFPGWAWGLVYPFRAGMGAGSLLVGVGIGLVLAGIGLILLWRASAGMSLTRAAQETRGRVSQQTAVIFGASELNREAKRRERLGSSRMPSRLPAYPGSGALPWKNAVQAVRSLSVGQFISWLSIPGLGLSMLLIPDVGTRIWLVILWIVLWGKQSIAAFRRDLSRWWLLRQLPYSSEQIVLLELGLPMIGIALVGAAILALSAWMGVTIPSAAGWLFLPGAVGVSLAAAIDVLRQCHVSHLLTGAVADRSLLSVLLGIFAIGVPGILAWWLIARLLAPPGLAIATALAVSLSLDYGLYRWAGSLLRGVR